MRWRICIAAFALVLSTGRATAGEERFQAFDIPAQALDTALKSYNDETGTASLADESLLAGRRSTALKGSLTPEEALKIMLAGTGLAIRYASRNSFALVPDAATAGTLSGEAERPRLPARDAFYAALQDTLVKTLCSATSAQPGTFDLSIQLWLDLRGGVRAVHLAGTTGNLDRDAQLKDTLATLRVAPPPGAIAQPVTVIFRQNADASVQVCGSAGSGGRDK